MSTTRMVRWALVLLVIAALVAIGARVWLRRREPAEPVPAGSASAPVAVPVATPAEPRAPVSVPVASASGAGRDGFTIKAKESSGLYHTPSSPAWSRLHADAWFETEQAAQAAGYKRWDWRRERS